MKQSHPTSLVVYSGRPRDATQWKWPLIVYKHTYKIINKQGEYWPPLQFHLAITLLSRNAATSFEVTTIPKAALNVAYAFYIIHYRTASDRKRLTVKDFSSIIGYCSSAHDWKERRMWIGFIENMSALGAACACRRTGVVKQDDSLATATRRAPTAHTGLRAHTNDSFKHTWLCFNPQPCMRDYRFHLLWLFHWPGLEQGAGACHRPARRGASK